MRNLTAGRLMRRDPRMVRATTTLGAFRTLFPLGSTSRVVLTGIDDQYQGIVRTADVSYLRAALAVREEIIAAGHSPSAELAGPADLRAAVARLAEHRLHPA